MKSGCCDAEIFPLPVEEMFDGSPWSVLATAMPAQKKRLTTRMFDVSLPNCDVFWIGGRSFKGRNGNGFVFPGRRNG